MATNKSVIDSLFYTNPVTSEVTEANFTLPYGTCETAASTAAKVVTCANFAALDTGASVVVLMSSANSAASATLNVNSTGAKTIKTERGGALSGSDLSPWKAGDIVKFVYDGTNWRAIASITRSDLVNALAQNDAMIYKGTVAAVATGSIPSEIPSAANKGWTYKVASASGTTCYFGSTKVEVGDMIICNTDCDGSTIDARSAAYWDIVQGNLDMKALEDKFSEATHTHTYSHTHKVSHTPAGTNTAAKLTPTGTVASSFTGTQATLTGSVSVESAGAHSHTFTGTAAEHSHTFVGTKGNVSVSGSASGNTGSKSLTPAGTISSTTTIPTGKSANYTPGGTIAASFTGTAASHSHTFTGSEATISTTYTPGGSVGSKSHSHTLTVDTATFTGTQATITSASKFATSGSVGSGGGHTPAGTIASTTTIPDGKTANYTPVGSVSTPTISFNSKDAKTVLTSAALSGGGHTHTPSSLAMTAASKRLTVTFTQGSGSHSNPTITTDNTSVIGGSATLKSTQPSFTGTPAYFTFTGNAVSGHTHTFTPTTSNVTATYTPAGTIAVAGSISSESHSHTFTGTEATISSKYTPEGTVNGKSVTPAGNVTATLTGTPAYFTFAGTAASHDHTFSTGTITSTGNFTPVGTINETSITPAGTVESAGAHEHDATLSMNAYKPAGSVTSTFTGAEAEHTHTFEGTAATITTTDQSATTTSAANK